jgi:hypothetical protein
MPWAWPVTAAATTVSATKTDPAIRVRRIVLPRLLRTTVRSLVDASRKPQSAPIPRGPLLLPATEPRSSAPSRCAGRRHLQGRGGECMSLGLDRSQQRLHKAAVEAQTQFVAPGFLPLPLAHRPRQEPAQMPLARHIGDAPLAHARRALCLLPAAAPRESGAVAMCHQEKQQHARHQLRRLPPLLFIALDSPAADANQPAKFGLAQTHLRPDLPHTELERP